MCIGTDGRVELNCRYLDDQPDKWSRQAPLMHPVELRINEQLEIFREAVRLAAAGDVDGARDQLGMMESHKLQTWFIEHANYAGYRRSKLRGFPSPATSRHKHRDVPKRRKTEEIFRRDGYRCRYCRIPVIPLEVLRAFSMVVGVDKFATGPRDKDRHGAVLAFGASPDHVIPKALFAADEDPNDETNLVTACWSCQFAKMEWTLEQVGLDDPRERAIEPVDGWDGLLSLLPDLQRNSRATETAEVNYSGAYSGSRSTGSTVGGPGGNNAAKWREMLAN